MANFVSDKQQVKLPRRHAKHRHSSKSFSACGSHFWTSRIYRKSFPSLVVKRDAEVFSLNNKFFLARVTSNDLIRTRAVATSARKFRCTSDNDYLYLGIEPNSLGNQIPPRALIFILHVIICRTHIFKRITNTYYTLSLASFLFMPLPGRYSTALASYLPVSPVQ